MQPYRIFRGAEDHSRNTFFVVEDGKRFTHLYSGAPNGLDKVTAFQLDGNLNGASFGWIYTAPQAGTILAAELPYWVTKGGSIVPLVEEPAEAWDLVLTDEGAQLHNK